MVSHEERYEEDDPEAHATAFHLRRRRKEICTELSHKSRESTDKMRQSPRKQGHEMIFPEPERRFDANRLSHGAIRGMGKMGEMWMCTKGKRLSPWQKS